MKTDREFIDSVHFKIAEQNKKYITPKKGKTPAGYISMAATVVCVICAVIFIPGLLNPILKDRVISGSAGTESEAAETEAVQHYRFEDISTVELCETYDLQYNLLFPDYVIQTDNLHSGERIPVAGVSLKIAALSEWTFSNTFNTTVNVDHLLYKLMPVQISLTEKSDTIRTIKDYLSMLSGTEPDIIVEQMRKSTVYYCVKYPDGPPTGEFSDAELEAYYNQVIAYFYSELDSGYLLRFLLLSTKDNIESDVIRCLAMLSTAEITEGNLYHFNIDLPIDYYTLVMSSVPGLPFTIKLNNDGKVNYNITATKGTLITWEDNGEIKPFVNGSEYGESITLYWSPLESDGSMAEETPEEGIAAVITVTVNTPDNHEGKRELTITSDGLYYYAHVSKFSYTG
ncbi:MAG: hypothetical protein ACYCWE_14130 [Eubacteriales bacterium]